MLSSGSRNKRGELGLRLRKRTIVPRTRQQQARASLVQLVDLGTGRTIAWSPTRCVACWNPKPEQLFAFTSGQQVLGRDTEQLFGLGSRLNQAGQEPEKRTMAVFCGFGGSPKPEVTRQKPEPESGRTRARLPEAPPQVFSANLWVLRYYVLSCLGRYGECSLFSCVYGQVLEIPVVSSVFVLLSWCLPVHVAHGPYLQAIL